HHLKKLEGRRLDYDYKKKRQGKIPDEELRQAWEKFIESKDVAETSMLNLLDTDVEQVSQLSALVEAQLDYHRQTVQILDELSDKLKDRVREASSRPKREYKPKSTETYDYSDNEQSNGGISCNSSVKAPVSSSFRSEKPAKAPSIRSSNTCKHMSTQHVQTHPGRCDHMTSAGDVSATGESRDTETMAGDELASRLNRSEEDMKGIFK
ncbi:PREDICTED: endophilin-A2-like, partial [Nanorana parkeri]|uniref:endophilin-A2-like n=1 Tax=Nanorana parkeri TaxID=125878 RepID=UPI00085420CA